MPNIEPVSHKSASGIREEPVFAQSWMNVPFDDYEGMTQQQFQDSIAPFMNQGKSVPVEVPKGWRRVESSRPGKQFYIHVATGTISQYPKEQYDCRQDCWVSKEGVKLTDEELRMHPEGRAVGYGPMPKPAEGGSAAGGAPPWLEPPKSAQPATSSTSQQAIGDAPLPVGLLFPGQGSQYIAMLSGVKDMPAVKDMLSTAERILGYDILDICLNGPEDKLEKTKHCQPALFIAGLAAIEKLKQEKPDRVSRCQGLAGLSLGEYTALAVAGVFSFEVGLRIVKVRGEAMSEAAQASPQSMVSVAGLDEETLNKLCEECRSGPEDVCQIANLLFPKGFSCAGSTTAIQTLMGKTDGAGALQTKLLKTEGAFHTPLMRSARERLMSALREAEADMKPPRCDVYMNLTGQKIPAGTPPAKIIEMLSDQIVSPVRWEASMKAMIQDGISEFYECGPMKQLKAMMKRIDPKIHNTTSLVEV